MDVMRVSFANTLKRPEDHSPASKQQNFGKYWPTIREAGVSEPVLRSEITSKNYAALRDDWDHSEHMAVCLI